MLRIRSARNSSAFTWLFAAWLMLLGHSIVPHVHHAFNAPHIHTHSFGHTIADIFGTDLGEGHLAHVSHETADPNACESIVLPASLPPFFSPQSVGAKTILAAEPIAIVSGYLRCSALRAPPKA